MSFLDLLTLLGKFFGLFLAFNILAPRLLKYLYPAKIGSLVLPIEGLKFIKGSEFQVPDIEAKRVTVIELWATWCGPCVKSIPHLTEIAKRYPTVSFVGITQETDEAKVREFVAQMGSDMDYGVAMDPQRSSARVQKDSQGFGIPHAVVVDAAGCMVWSGHPMSTEFEAAIVAAGKAS